MQEERDDIEKFFAKRLGEKEFPFEEEQWEILAERLDNEAPVKPPFWLWFRRRLGYVLIPIITFLIGWYWQKGIDDAEQKTVPIEVPVEIPSTTDKSSESGLEESPSQGPSNSQITPSRITQEDRQAASAELTEKSEARLVTSAIEEVRSNKTEARKSQNLSVPPIGANNLIYFEIAPLHMLELDFPLAEVEGGIALAVADSTHLIEEEAKPQWSVTLLAAPDFSSTNVKDLYNSLGQTVGLQFNRSGGGKVQWGFGLLLNNKIYTAGRGEYAPTRGYSGSIVEPDMTDAKCLVLEVPLSVGMRLFSTKRGSVWANAGLSSYVFLTEKYSYYYDTYDPDQPKGWEGKNVNRHFAAGLGFSFLYAHTLSERFSLMIEPYFKSTIQPVGHGNVDLLSTGLNVGLNYKFSPNNKK